MPELPEVESARSLVEEHCVGAKVLTVEFNEDGTFDEKIFAGTTAKDFRKALMGRTLDAARRHGKHMWWELSGATSTSSSPLFHFGMTGAMSVRGKGAMKYKAFVVDVDNWPPKFAKLIISFDNGVSLAYTDPRRFGRVRLVVGDVVASPPISTLGFDPLLAMPEEDVFAAHFTARSAPIKSVLLKQEIAAGVGNWIADEVLYQAGIHPEQPSHSLTHARLCAMRHALSAVVGEACAAGADAEKFPAGWLFHHRWGKVGGSKVGGKAISFITVGGRTTAFVPGVQKKTSVVKAAASKAAAAGGGGGGEGLSGGRRKRAAPEADPEDQPPAGKRKAPAKVAAAAAKAAAPKNKTPAAAKAAAPKKKTPAAVAAKKPPTKRKK